MQRPSHAFSTHRCDSSGNKLLAENSAVQSLIGRRQACEEKQREGLIKGNNITKIAQSENKDRRHRDVFQEIQEEKKGKAKKKAPGTRSDQLLIA